MLIKNICKNKKNSEKNKNMIRGIHYFSTELKTKIDVIPRGCFNNDINICFISIYYCGRNIINSGVHG